MKNAGSMQKKCFILILCIIAGIFVSSCGLEEVYSITEPTVTYNNPLYSNPDHLTWYFNFKTAPKTDDENLSYTGTDIYYKIYNNYSNLISHKSAILAVNTAANGNSAATKLIETYTYQQLGMSTTTTDETKAVFCEGHDNTRCIIRLKNYQNGLGAAPEDTESAEYAEYIENRKMRYTQEACIGYYKNENSTEYDYEESYIPFRNGNSKSFDFFDYDEDDKNGNRDVEPEEGDSDYYYNSSGFSDGYDNTYFVQLFAVARAWNSSAVSPVYSLVLDLGSVPIIKGK